MYYLHSICELLPSSNIDLFEIYNNLRPVISTIMQICKQIIWILILPPRLPQSNIDIENSGPARVSIKWLNIIFIYQIIENDLKDTPHPENKYPPPPPLLSRKF